MSSAIRRIFVLMTCVAAGLCLGFLGGRLGRPSLSEPHVSETDLNMPFTAEPDALAVFPCTRRTHFDDPYAVCILILAGGKRLVFGAPMDQDWRGIGRVDGVFLPNGHPVSMGGLLSLRHRTWWAGRNAGLVVTGGDLLTDEIGLLETAMNRADALVAMEFDGSLEFLAAALRPRPVPGKAQAFRVFDTGDLQVFAYSRSSPSGDQILSFEIRYGAERLFLQPCGGADPPEAITSLILPTSDKSPLVDLQRTARATRQTDLVRDYQRMGEACRTSREALDFAESKGVSRIILIRPTRDIQEQVSTISGGVDTVSEAGIRLR